jgi:ankyrin repeat protein
MEKFEIEDIIKINIHLLLEDDERSSQETLINIINDKIKELNPEKVNNLLLYIFDHYDEKIIKNLKKIISDLVLKSTNLDLQDKNGKTVLMLAFETRFFINNDDLICDIINKSKNLDLQDKDGKTALMKADESELFNFDDVSSDKIDMLEKIGVNDDYISDFKKSLILIKKKFKLSDKRLKKDGKRSSRKSRKRSSRKSRKRSIRKSRKRSRKRSSKKCK